MANLKHKRGILKHGRGKTGSPYGQLSNSAKISTTKEISTAKEPVGKGSGVWLAVGFFEKAIWEVDTSARYMHYIKKKKRKENQLSGLHDRGLVTSLLSRALPWGFRPPDRMHGETFRN